MTLDVKKYVRRPFAVEAVQVTPDNIHEVAKWCGGRVKKTDPSHWSEHAGQQYIKVRVPRALNERQTMAYYGDWVLSSGTGPSGFKVYTPKAFTSSFQEEVENMVRTLERMEERAEAEERAEEQDETLGFAELAGNRVRAQADPLRPFSQPSTS